MEIYATLPELHVTDKGAERSKEIYVISLASDLRGQTAERGQPVGSHNEPISGLSTGIDASMDYYAIAVSHVFTGISEDQPVSMSGDGIVLYPPEDPEGMLSLYFVIAESDQSTRDVGSILDSILEDADVQELMRQVSEKTAAEGSIDSDLLSSLFSALAGAVPTALEANGDDMLFAHTHTGVDFTGYGGIEGGASFEIGNDRAGGTLRLWTRESEAS